MGNCYFNFTAKRYIKIKLKNRDITIAKTIFTMRSNKHNIALSNCSKPSKCCLLLREFTTERIIIDTIFAINLFLFYSLVLLLFSYFFLGSKH